MNSMIELILDLEIEDLRSRNKPDPFTTEFIFGHLDEHTRARNRTIALGPNGPVTMLSAMLRYGLDDAKRANLFPNPFDLGSAKRIPEDQKTLAYLAQKVRRERRLPDDPGTRKKAFGDLTRSLKEMTGRRFSDYKEKQNSLRVLYLLDRMMLAPKDAIHGREKRFLTLMKTPTSKFAYEVRSTYPTLDSEGNTHLLNDLKAYFGIEIAVKSLDRIDFIFSSLIERFEKVREHLDNIAYSLWDQERVANGYRALQALVEAVVIDEAGDPVEAVVIDEAGDPSETAVRLDKDLYIHLNRIEFLHFAGEFRNVLKKAEPPSPINSIKGEMLAVLSKMLGGQQEYRDLAETAWELSVFSPLADNYSEYFLFLIEKALGFRPSEKEYAHIVALANELLYRVKRFGSNGPPLPRDQLLVSFREAVSGLCAAAQAKEVRIAYRPRIFGDDTQSRSIITTLERPLDLEGATSPREEQEGYLQLWHIRRELVQHALEGSSEVAALKFDLRNTIFSKIVECISHDDIATIDKALLTLETALNGLQPSDLHV
jgi:hypothetical protein